MKRVCKISKATKFDIKEIVDLGEIMHQEGAYKWLPYSKSKLTQLANHLIDKDTGVIYVARQDDKIIGMFVCYVTKYFFCDELLANDLLLYVHPEHRHFAMLPIKLVKKGLEWAKAKGAREFCPASSVAIASDKVEKLYNFMKFDTVGHIFKRRLN